MGAEKEDQRVEGSFISLNGTGNQGRNSSPFHLGPKQEKRTDADLNGAKLILVDEDETVGISSMKESSDYSCASSVTDERNGIREPGVVAKLMGLDSIPTSIFSEPFSTPLFDVRSSSHKRSPDFFINDQFNHARSRAEVHSRKPVEFRSQKLPSSPIERFQIETLPPRSAKAVPQIHHKLMSPIKNTGFISPQNAAHIMEAAAKILEPALPVKTKAKASSSYVPLKICDPKDRIAPSQRTPRVLELGRRPVESSDMKFLKGQSLNRSWNGSEDRSSQDISDTNSLNGMGKSKSVSLAIQAKVNVQKREGLSLNRKNTSSIAKDVDEAKLNQPFKSQQSKIKQHKKASISGGSSVLRQNNQKHNSLSGKGKLNPKQSVSKQQERKILYEDTSSRKNDTTSSFSGHSRLVYRDDTLETSTTDHENLLSSNKNFPRKKRLTEGGFNSQRNSFVDNNASKQRHVQPDVVIDEQSRWNKDNKNDGADVVSFTFNSPLVKSRPGLPSFIPAEENCDKVNICATDGNIRRNDFTAKKKSSYGLNLITGDALSFLLEQKLKELTSGNESSCCNFVEAASSKSSIPLKQEKLIDIDSRSANNVGHEKQFMPRTFCRDKQSPTFSSGTSSTNGKVFGSSYNLQGLEEAECSSNSNAWNESDSLQPSPLSILEASLSESSNSSLSSISTNGSKMSLHSVQAQNIISSCTKNKIPSLEAELEQSYSSSSSPSSVGSLFSSENQSNHRKSNNPDLDYVKDILNSRRTGAMELALRPLNPLLFNKLEKKRCKDGRIRRKMMFDCVNECLNSKYSLFLRSGYQAWANGEAMMPKNMAENVYEEISRWKGFGDCMVDELVDRDMSSGRGRWVDFDTEAFELGMEMEEEIISSLVDEVFIDISVEI
ncbi:hypothetical protein IEQ34_010270 [Dendrobium chrysotoxum]|uniref:DUF4378 domain-containing protein n=1 Tax=Dendrobium chrysotoxum TaxID=161865 RepID=A0AAV7H5B3_DENCH|nr:hypothetical protein IEQ34_010270 [Dendrobium chrysotoxum]